MLPTPFVDAGVAQQKFKVLFQKFEPLKAVL